MFNEGEVISTYLLHVTLIKEREEKAHKHWILTFFLYKFADPAQRDKVVYYFISVQSSVQSKEELSQHWCIITALCQLIQANSA